MKIFSRAWRLVTIFYIFLKNGFYQLLCDLKPLQPMRFLRFLNPFYLKSRKLERGVVIRKTLEQLGPIFVKFGQIISTRLDLLPPDIAMELVKLQDRVPPFPSKAVAKILLRDYKKPVEEMFANFSYEPLASASIAQVHAATLFDGKEVVVKVLRPGIKRIIKRDTELMLMVARLIEYLAPNSRRLHPVAVVQEFQRTILDELNLLREAGNASQLRRNFANSDMLYVPEIYWDYTNQKVMVIERITGVPISDIEALKANKVDFKQLAERGVEIFFTQVFMHGFFHADMHPGNIFVDVKNMRYIAVDFGIVGTLTPEDKDYLVKNFIAFFNRDYRRVAELHVESGWVPADTRVDDFESAIRTVSEPIFEKPLKEISFGQSLVRLFQIAQRFNMEVQPQLTLLQKTLLSVEGLGRQLYPELDLWSTAKPFLEKWMRAKVGVAATSRKFRANLPMWIEKVPDLPQRMLKLLEDLEQVSLKEATKEHVAHSEKSLLLAIFAGSVVVSASAIAAVMMLLPDTHDYWWAPTIAVVTGILMFRSAWKKARI